MFQIQLTDFRCFADASLVEIRPITFLVGENSAGKTTFMAATKVLFESFTRTTLNPFNSEPYHLGGFDQIAHYRRGVRGRAKKFCLELIVPGFAQEASAPRSRTRPPSVTTRHKFTFVRGAPQPELSCYEFVVADITVKLDFMDKRAVLHLLEHGDEIFQFISERGPPSALLKKEVSYIRYLFDEMTYGLKEEEIEKRPNLKGLLENVVHQFRASLNFATRRVFATAPVRTQPLRTYTPSEITASAEGAHVPLEMARQKVNSSTDWVAVHDKLAQFGVNSGLFEDIDIRMLGKKDGDPFQLTVQTGGPPMNIVDVGYGVSQALPIIYQLEQAKQYDAFLLQQPEVHLHPRAQAELGSLIARVSKQRPTIAHLIETHSDYIIDRVRMEVASGRLDPKMVTIVFFDRSEHSVKPTNIYLSEKGEILDPPDNFRDFFLKEQQRLLGL